uniref:Wiskott-Aldrich syndrome protein family member n=1 Tax=Anopheles minimus TaxID=112268 RepID=A0A182VTQ3_9DIPT
MPLPKRLVQPVFVARSVYVREELPAELETVTNTTLTNIVRQLSSLSKHAEDLFGELARDAGGLAERANSLQARIDRLAIKVTQLDSTVEEVSLQDIQMKKAFKSATMFDQQIFSRATMPSAMLEVYKTCDKPPPLDKLNCYRDDGKDGLKFYTDPNYFFELWRQEMLKDTERVMHDRGKKVHKPRADGGAEGGGRQKKRPRAPHNTREKQRQRAIGHGETLMPNNVIYRTPNAIIGSQEEAIYNSAMAGGPGGSMIYDSRSSSAMGGSSSGGAARPNSIELRRSYQQPNEMVDGGGYAPPSPGGGYHQHQQMAAQLQHQQAGGVYQQQQPIYDQYGNPSIYGSGANQMSQESLYAPGTPSRSKSRPSQPPPAPPSSGSGGGTPNASNGNTPTRSRSLSTGRDNLPPPPPIPEGLQSPPHGMSNGGPSVAAKMLLNRSAPRAGSPQLGMTGSQQQQQQQHQHQHVVVQSMMDQNQLALAQLNQQINNLNNLNMQLNQMSMNDLPPPPPIPEQLSPKQSPPNVAPPPPPPPPPMLDGPLSPTKAPLANGDLYNMPKMHQLKKIPPQEKITYDDPRSDLMKAIRDGIKLRKVEKQNHEAKENDRNKGLHDVASILARRVAIELSESESSESDDDSEGWQETNETSA